MSVVIFPDIAGLLALLNLTTVWETDGFYVHLYTGNITPSAGDNVATYSSTEASFAGYSSAAVTMFTTPMIVAGVPSTNANAVSFTQSSGSSVNVYGFYVMTTSDNTGMLICSGRLDSAPFTFSLNTLMLNITLTLGRCASCVEDWFFDSDYFDSSYFGSEYF